MAKTIVIHESELSEMRLFYQTELDKTLRRLQHIQGILAKLGFNELEAFSAETAEIGAKRVSKQGLTLAAHKPVRAKRGRKRGPASVWSNFVLEKLKQLAKPLTYDQLVDEALEFSKLPSDQRKKVQQSITNVTFKLRNKDNKIDTFSRGTRIKYIALKSWFNEDGSIKSEFANKADEVLPKNDKSKVKPAPKTRSKKVSVKAAKVAKPRVKAVKAAKAAPIKNTDSAAKPAAAIKPRVKKSVSKKAAPKAATARKKPTKKPNPTK